MSSESRSDDCFMSSDCIFLPFCMPWNVLFGMYREADRPLVWGFMLIKSGVVLFELCCCCEHQKLQIPPVTFSPFGFSPSLCGALPAELEAC